MSRKAQRSIRLSPSDLAERPPARGPVEVGARVVLAGEGELRLADAYSSITARGRELQGEPGDLVVVSGSWNGTVLERARLLERIELPEPTADGEFARLSWQGVGGRLRARARALATLRSYFDERNFIEIDPPQRVRAPGVDLHVDALRADGGYLTTSPELQLKRLLVGGVPRCYSLGHAFRADEQGSLHEPEYLLLEWYRAFAGQAEVQDDTEQLVDAVARELRGKAELLTPDGRRLSTRLPFPRISVSEAFKRHAGVSDAAALAEDNENRYFELLVDCVEPALAEVDRPIFLCDYPLSQAALARPSPENPKVAERFELYAGGVELCNGYGELTDPVEQQRRFQLERKLRAASKRRVYPLDRRFLAALKEGMPPSGGNALGVDRLVMLATGAKSIQDVCALPWSR